MLNPERFASLSTFSSTPLLVTSFYATTDARREPRTSALLHLKGLIHDRTAELKAANLTHAQLQSVEADFQHLSTFVASHNFSDLQNLGLAAFSCAGRDLFQTFALPHGFKTTLLVGPTPYLRPLNALLAQSTHAVALLVDHHRARAFTFHGDNAHDLFDISHNTGRVPATGGLGGKDERHVEHHHDEVVHHHYQIAADRLLATFQSAPFQYLVLAGHAEDLRAFERHLHSYVAERLAGRFRADLRSATRDEIRAKTIEIVRTEESNRRTDAVHRLIGASRTHGSTAVVGLKNTLAALNDRRVQTLLVSESLRTPGRHCKACETLFDSEAVCPRCGEATLGTADVVDEAIAVTVHQGGAIRMLPADSPLAAHGSIGAMLRY